MNRHAAWKMAALAVLAIFATSCKTRQPVEPTTDEKVPAGAPVFFHPAVAVSPINLENGRYPTLFGGGSRATWVEPVAPPTPMATPAKASVEGMNKEDPKMLSETVAAPSLDAQVRKMAENFNVIVCDIESTFTDSSIAYDVVGFRNIQAYLLTPDGHQIMPVQRMIGSDLSEEPMGALKKYHRTNILLFPRQPVPVAAPLAGTPAPGMRLVLDGYGSKFYFQWPAQIPGDIGAPALKDREAVKKGEKAYHTIRKKERSELHKFD